MTKEQRDGFNIMLATMKTFLSMYNLSHEYSHYYRYIDAVRGLMYYCSKNNINAKIPVYGIKHN